MFFLGEGLDDCFLKLGYLYVVVCTHTFAHNKVWNMYHLKMRDFNCHLSSPGGIKYIYYIYDTITERYEEAGVIR